MFQEGHCQTAHLRPQSPGSSSLDSQDSKITFETSSPPMTRKKSTTALLCMCYLSSLYKLLLFKGQAIPAVLPLDFKHC